MTKSKDRKSKQERLFHNPSISWSKRFRNSKFSIMCIFYNSFNTNSFVSCTRDGIYMKNVLFSRYKFLLHGWLQFKCIKCYLNCIILLYRLLQSCLDDLGMFIWRWHQIFWQENEGNKSFFLIEISPYLFLSH